MPYIKERQEPFSKMGRLLRGYGLNGVSLGAAIGTSPPTAKKKLDHPELFTLAELDLINRKLHIPIDEIREAIQR